MSGILSTKCLEINGDGQVTAVPTQRRRGNSNVTSTISPDKTLYKPTPSISEMNLQIPQPCPQQPGLRIAMETWQLTLMMLVRSFATTLTHQMTILPLPLRPLHRLLRHQLLHFHQIRRIVIATKTDAQLIRLYVVPMALARSRRARNL